MNKLKRKYHLWELGILSQLRFSGMLPPVDRNGIPKVKWWRWFS